MATILRMPKLSDTMSEGTIAKWLKKVGELVNEGDTLLEVETDKATMEYHAPDDGHLLQILVDDAPVQVGAPIAVFGAKGEKFDLQALVGGQQPTQEPAPEQAQEPEPVSVSEPVASGRVRASPLARKIAAASGLELHDLRGTGPRGRVVAQDVVDAKPLDAKPHSSGGGAAGVRASPTASRIKISTLRKALAKRLTSAKNEAPHFYLQRSVDVSQLLRVQAKFKQQFNLNTLISYICVHSLCEHPEVNSSWHDGKEIIQHHAVHLATAVALPNGLVTPVVRDSERLSVVELHSRMSSAIAGARAGKLANEDLLGGTFTISNLGMFGIERFTAIINPPQAAILAVGAVRDQLALGQGGQLSVRKEMTLTLSCDHRVVDGAMGARFLATLAGNLELPFVCGGLSPLHTSPLSS
ncbi:MAG: dihydrolipoamide acetyltransferase family protein [Pseudomonadota bacterium]|nr:dihydrolipoamide acetyltransferase family protein [Pseudomonadota bacterium]